MHTPEGVCVVGLLPVFLLLEWWRFDPPCSMPADWVRVKAAGLSYVRALNFPAWYWGS